MKSIVLYGLKSEREAYQCTRYEILGCEHHTEQDSIDFKLYLEQTGVRVY